MNMVDKVEFMPQKNVEDSCAVCLETLSKGAIVGHIISNPGKDSIPHLFHEYCVKQVLSQTPPKCPLCQRIISIKLPSIDLESQQEDSIPRNGFKRAIELCMRAEALNSGIPESSYRNPRHHQIIAEIDRKAEWKLNVSIITVIAVIVILRLWLESVYHSTFGLPK